MPGWDAQSLYGMGAGVPAADTGTSQANPVAHDWAPGVRGLVDPRNPLMWFGVILLATVGAAGIAGSVRLGPAKLSGQVGSA